MEKTETGGISNILYRIFPKYAWIPVILAFAVQLIVYCGLKIPVRYLQLHDLTTQLDRMIPFIPEWIVIYVLSYLSWFITIRWIVSESKEKCYRFAAIYITGFLITGVCFLVYPCTLERAELTGTGFFVDMVRLIYAADDPLQLFPSVHILIAYYCWRCTIDCRKIPVWYKWFNFVFLILTCLSILFVRQHVIADIPSAIITAEISIMIGRVYKPERILYNIVAKLSKSGGNGNA